MGWGWGESEQGMYDSSLVFSWSEVDSADVMRSLMLQLLFLTTTVVCQVFRLCIVHKEST